MSNLFIGYFRAFTDSKSIIMLSTISKIFSLLPEKNNLDFETRGVSFPKNIDIVPAYGLKIGILVDINKDLPHYHSQPH